jgi:cellobiose-specific phosphotransferase system component IIB
MQRAIHIEQPVISIDQAPVQKSHINLSDRSLPTDFGLDDYVFTKVLSDVILIEFADLVADETAGDYIIRGGIAIPIDQIHNAWRKGRVILVGPAARYTVVDDIIIFPANMGIPITNLNVEGYGKVKKGLFINEDRIFGYCKVK